MGYYVTFDDDQRPILTDQPGATGSDLLNGVYFSLATPRGTWFLDPTLGSRLHLLRKEKCLPRTESLLKDYIAEALQWLLDLGRIISFETTTERIPAARRIKYHVAVRGVAGEVISYSNFVRVI